MGGDDVHACSITAFCPVQDTEETSWSPVGLSPESSEDREMGLSSLGSALFHGHREAGVPREKPKAPSQKLMSLFF